ncbi:uncharacterized protein LOC143292460 [Babylonia areolata]|uniref:uncharacterized protein LOC143292460 n=1 Tax=Babylonia areolata TaxID=304850 RepID=UPI003FD2AC84
MKIRGVVFALGILGFCCSLSFAVNCDSTRAMQAAQRRCFTDHGLEINTGSDKIQESVLHDPEYVCQNQAAYRKALHCALSIGRKCLVHIGRDRNLLPKMHKVSAGLGYLCDHIHDFDTQCAKDNKAELEHCGRSKALLALSEGHNLDAASIICMAYKGVAECVEEMQGCDSQTKHIYLRYIQKYMAPPACQHVVQPDPGYEFSTVAPMTTTHLVTMLPMLPKVSCSFQRSILNAQEECFAREGISVNLPEIRLESGQAAKQSYLDAIMSNSRDFSTVCRNLSQYQRGLGCALDVGHHCMPAGLKDYLPSSRHVQMLMAELCNNIDDLDQKCVKSKVSAMMDCVLRIGKKYPSNNVKTLLCNAFKFSTVCQKEVLPSCGCKTTRLYVKMSSTFMNPPACPPIREPVPECLADSDHFAYTGVATQSLASVGLLAIAAALAGLIVV